MSEENFGEHEGKIIINHDGTRYTIPFLIHYTQGSISVSQQNQKLSFDIFYPGEWSFAKISVINSKDGKVDTTTMLSNKKTTMEIYENAEYWIEAKIRTNENTTSAYNTIEITTLPENVQRLDIGIPTKQIGIIAIIVAAVGIFGIIKRK
jgi:minor extracellular serine protease Vpr